MERLTERKGDIVYMKKDGELIPPANMSGQEIRKVMLALSFWEETYHEFLNPLFDYFENEVFEVNKKPPPA